MCLQELGQLDAAKQDLTACCSAVQAIGDDWKGGAWLPNDAVKKLLIVIAKQKHKAGTARPLYTEVESDKTEKDLGLNMYNPVSYRCEGCCSGPLTQVALKKCGGCLRAWFCGKQCQLKAWKGHKSGCQKVSILTFRDEDLASVDKDFEGRGVVSWTSCHNGLPRALLFDDEKRRYYDALTDEDMYFLPSEKTDLLLRTLKNSLNLSDPLRSTWVGPFISEDKTK